MTGYSNNHLKKIASNLYDYLHGNTDNLEVADNYKSYSATYYHKNHDNALARQRQYYTENKDRINARRREHRKIPLELRKYRKHSELMTIENKLERAREYKRKYREEGRYSEYNKEYLRLWRERNKDKVSEYRAKAKARKRAEREQTKGAE